MTIALSLVAKKKMMRFIKVYPFKVPLNNALFIQAMAPVFVNDTSVAVAQYYVGHNSPDQTNQHSYDLGRQIVSER